MKHLTLTEHSLMRAWNKPGAAPAGYLEARLYHRLKKYEQSFEKGVLKWEDGRFKTTQWVGVIQVPGLCLEIVPKIDQADSDQQSRDNLLWMLMRAGLVPLRSSGVAHLATQSLPLLEWFALRYSQSLQTEWLKGPARAYLSQQENLRRYRGKLVLNHQIRHNLAHKERFWCQYDQFTADTLLNRCLKAASHLLLKAVRSNQVQEFLRQNLALMQDVSDVAIPLAELEQVQFNRQNERFATLFSFASQILRQQTPSLKSGEQPSFSLLFDMNIVFERYIAALMTKHLKDFNGYPLQVFLQAQSHHRYLMKGPKGNVLQLKPDLLLKWQGQMLILDTKWKRLRQEKGRQGVSREDLYQMYAYNRRYGCQTSFLVYPETPGISPVIYTALDQTSQADGQVGVRTLNLHRPLQTQENELIQELKEIVQAGFSAATQESEASVC